MILRRRPLAKDGADLPEGARAPQLARLPLMMGETYDFEFIPEKPGHLRLELRTALRLMVPIPILVH